MRVLVAGVIAVVLGAAAALAQPRLTPGGVALLARPKGLADFKLLEQALVDSQPAIRAVAARVAGLLGHKPAAPILLEALGREQDAPAGAEQVRALLYLQGTAALPAVRDAASRLSGQTILVVAQWAAREQPAEFASMIGELLKQPQADSASDLGTLGAIAVLQTPAERSRISQALVSAPSGHAWRSYLSRSRTMESAEASSALKTGLTAADAAVREQTIWFAVGLLADRKPLPLETISTSSGPEGEWAMFGLELLNRRISGKIGRDYGDIVGGYAKEHQPDARNAGLLPELSVAERRALRAAIPNLPEPPREGSPPSLDTSTSLTSVRMVSAIVPGFLESVFAAVDCRMASNLDAFGAVRLTYRPDGRPKQIGLDPSQLSPACAQMLDIVASLSIADWDEPVLPDSAQWLFVPTNKEVVNCADTLLTSLEQAKSRRRTQASGGSGTIKPPTKTRNVQPDYPETMRLARVQGVVVLEATITPQGCVAGAKVLRGVRPLLDFAAVRAVSAWRFTPTLLNGEPVPVIMTVTVNFSLQ